jgi:hypothetical protein
MPCEPRFDLDEGDWRRIESLNESGRRYVTGGQMGWFKRSAELIQARRSVKRNCCKQARHAMIEEGFSLPGVTTQISQSLPRRIPCAESFRPAALR